MSSSPWQIPTHTRDLLDAAPRDRAVVLLLRHSVRGHLPAGDAGYATPITEDGRRLAVALGEVLGDRLRSLRSSPLPRCVQTAEALAEGARAQLAVVPDRLLGDPGVYVLDGRRAWPNWERLGHEGVMEHLVGSLDALPGMARPREAARFLVRSMLAVAGDQSGVHVFVTHDSLVTATAACLLGLPLGVDDWPWYLEGAFFWEAEGRVHAAYRDHRAARAEPLCGLTEVDVVELARREIEMTVGLDSGARFFLAGGAFKSLITGRPPRDLDLWAPSERDRAALVSALRARGARSAGARAFSDAFEIGGRVVEVPFKTEPDTLAGRLERFDIGLAAVGVEHRPGDHWSAQIHSLALESVRRREVRLLKPLENWRYALTTLERARRYALELGYSLPAVEEAEVWRVFEAQDDETRAGMIERYRRTGSGGFGVMEEVACRFP